MNNDFRREDGSPLVPPVNAGAADANINANPGTNSTSVPNPATASPAGTVNATPSMAVPPKKKSHLKLVLAVVIPLVVIVGGLLTWYFAYFNNPYVVVSQALNNAMQNREDTMDYTIDADLGEVKSSGSGSVKFLASGKSSADLSIKVESDGTSMDIGKLSFATDASTYYLKVDLGKYVQQMLSSLSSTPTSSYNQPTQQPGITTTSAATSTPTTTTTNPLDGLTDQWIKITADDLDSMTSSSVTGTDKNKTDMKLSEMTQCFQAGSDELDNKASRQQLVSAWVDTKFLVVTADGSDKDGKIYSVKLDSSKLQGFVNGLSKSNYMHAISDCLGSKGVDVNLDEVDESEVKEMAENIDDANIRAKLWIKGMDRKLNRAQLSSKLESGSDEGTIAITLQWHHQVPTIDMPSNAKDIQTLMQESQLLSTMGTLVNNSKGNYGETDQTHH